VLGVFAVMDFKPFHRRGARLEPQPGEDTLHENTRNHSENFVLVRVTSWIVSSVKPLLKKQETWTLFFANCAEENANYQITSKGELITAGEVRVAVKGDLNPKFGWDLFDHCLT
jgi:hypothetical protein